MGPRGGEPHPDQQPEVSSSLKAARHLFLHPSIHSVTVPSTQSIGALSCCGPRAQAASAPQLCA